MLERIGTAHGALKRILNRLVEGALTRFLVLARLDLLHGLLNAKPHLTADRFADDFRQLFLCHGSLLLTCNPVLSPGFVKPHGKTRWPIPTSMILVKTGVRPLPSGSALNRWLQGWHSKVRTAPPGVWISPRALSCLPQSGQHGRAGFPVVSPTLDPGRGVTRQSGSYCSMLLSLSPKSSHRR